MCVLFLQWVLIIRVAMILKSCSLPGVLPFRLRNKKLAIQHVNTSLFLTTISIPSYGIGK